MREICEALFELTSTRRKASCLQLAAHSAIRHDRSLQEITCAAWWTICSCGLCHLSPRLPATAVRYFRRVLISSYAGYCTACSTACCVKVGSWLSRPCTRNDCQTGHSLLRPKCQTRDKPHTEGNRRSYSLDDCAISPCCGRWVQPCALLYALCLSPIQLLVCQPPAGVLELCSVNIPI